MDEPPLGTTRLARHGPALAVGPVSLFHREIASSGKREHWSPRHEMLAAKKQVMRQALADREPNSDGIAVEAAAGGASKANREAIDR
jgi:hypothetical protein